MIAKTSTRLAALALAVLAGQASAQLLIDPSGGTVLSTTGDTDNVYVGRSLGFTGKFFGEDKTTVDVSVDGNLNFSNNGSSSNGAFPNGVARIAPAWDNMFVYAGNTVTENAVAGQYYAVTWKISTHSFAHVYREFQVVWFAAPMTIGGIDFKADDIAFCYHGTGANNVSWNLTAGLNKGDSATFVPTPRDTDALIGQVEAADVLPSYDPTGGIVLFRPVGNTYASVIVAGLHSDCPADFNGDNVADFFDYLDFVSAFDAGCE